MYIKQENNNKNYGIGFVGLLQLLFIALKLIGIINWSWWLVLLPIIIWGGIVLLLLIFIAILAIITH